MFITIFIMNFIALKMLVGNRAKYLGIIFGLTFASLLITQQSAIFVGLMTRTFSFLTDTSLPEIWVVDPKVQYIDDLKPLKETESLRVRGVEGVAWAVPLYKGLQKARLPNGNFQACNVIGLDDETLIGGPSRMVQGQLADLRQSDAVIVDSVSVKGRLAKILPDGRRVPLKIGDSMELNDHRAVIVGICQVQRPFQSQPVVYTTFSRATMFAPRERKLMSFVLVKAKPGQNLSELCRRISQSTGLAAYTVGAFKDLTVKYYMKYTGIPINFGITVVLGFIVGIAIAGQTFYNFTLDNIRYFGTLKAMGATDRMLLRMILLQAATVGSIGYGLGVGAASVLGSLSGKTELSFRMPWQLLLISAFAVMIICLASAALSIRKVVRLEPAIVFKS
ncbi:MAG: ABC transporter permease [Candidatus Brocadiaceae bacterium]|nr:ABC transporter permease [Candidatus Brocadiaceae bacterium]